MLVLHLALLVVERRRSSVGGAVAAGRLAHPAFQGGLRDLQRADRVLGSAIGGSLGSRTGRGLGRLGARWPLVGRLPHCWVERMAAPVQVCDDWGKPCGCGAAFAKTCWLWVL